MSINYNSEDLADHAGVAAVIKNEAGEILMQEHVKYGCWTIPVGKVKEGQDIVDGLRQEIMEECGLEIIEFSEMTRQNFLYEREGKKVKVAGYLFEITKYVGEPQNMEPLKHNQQLFLSIEEIAVLAYLSDMTLVFLETLGVNRRARI